MGTLNDGGAADGGAAAVTEKIIGPEGGTLTTPEGVVLTVPAGAVATPTRFAVQKTSMGTLPAGLRALGDAYRIEPESLPFSKAVRVSLPVPRGQVTTQNGLLLLRQPTGSPVWGAIGGAAASASSVSGATHSFSAFTLAELLAAASLFLGCSVEDLSAPFTQAGDIAPTSCSNGLTALDPLTLSLSCNAGGAASATTTCAADPSAGIACSCMGGGSTEPMPIPALPADCAGLASTLRALACHCGWPCGGDGGAVADAGIADAGADGGGPDDGGATTRGFVSYRLLEEANNIVAPRLDGGGFRRACWLSVPTVSASGQVAYHVGERILERLTTAPEGTSLRVHARPIAGGPPETTPHLLPAGSGPPQRVETICAPHLNDQGSIVFRATIAGSASGGVWSARPGADAGVAVVIPPNARPPDLTAAETLSVQKVLGLDAESRTFALGQVSGANEATHGVWYAAGGISKLLREAEDPITFLGDVDGVFTVAGRAFLRNKATNIIEHQLIEASIGSGGGPPLLLAATDEVALPGTDGGIVTAIGGFGAAKDDVVLESNVLLDGTPACALWARRGGTIRVLRTGERVDVEGVGDASFACELTAVESQPDECFSLTDAVIACNTCPCGPGVRPSSRVHVRGPVINAQGEIAAAVRLNDRPALVRWGATALRIVALAGDPAPDTQVGTLFERFSPDDSAAVAPSMNSRGQIAFYARLTGAGVTAENDRALYLTDPLTLTPRLVLRTGAIVPILSDVSLQILDFEFQNGSGGSDGRRTGLSNSGELAVFAQARYFGEMAQGPPMPMVLVLKLESGGTAPDGGTVTEDGGGVADAGSAADGGTADVDGGSVADGGAITDGGLAEDGGVAAADGGADDGGVAAADGGADDGGASDGGASAACPASGFYVDAYAPYAGDPDGTPERPYYTLEAALLARNCDPLILQLPMNGGHQESITVYGRNIDIRGNGSGLYGRIASIGGDLSLSNLVVNGGEDTGVHKRGGLLYVRNVTVSQIGATPGVADSGFGILLEDGARGDLAAVILEDNQGSGLVLRGSTTSATAGFLTVRRNGANTAAAFGLRELYGKFLGGVEVHEGATLFLSNSAFTQARGIGIGVHDGGRVRISNVDVSDIAQVSIVDDQGPAFVQTALFLANNAVADIDHFDANDGFVGVNVAQAYLTQVGGTLTRFNTGVFFTDGAPSTTFVRTPPEYRWWGCTRDTTVLESDVAVYVTSYQTGGLYPGPGDVTTGPIEPYCRRVEP